MASSLLPPEEMRRIIFQSETPMVFRGLIDSWPMLGFSQSDWISFFADRRLECRVGLRQFRQSGDPQWEGRCDSVQCRFSDLVRWTQGGGRLRDDLQCDKHFLYFGYKYMKDTFNPEAVRMVDWGPLGYPDRDGSESTFWLGTADAHTPCHYDTYGCNLVAQVSGRKRWILYPPADSALLEPSRVPYEESSVYSRINFQQWGAHQVPDIGGSHPHVVELLPGDVLLVPRHWWHYVHNQELSVSINTWLERPEDEEVRLQEGLVKFFMANVSRNIPPSLSSELLNPNEEDTAFVELDEIQSCIGHSFRALGSNQSNPSALPIDIDPRAAACHQARHQWMIPVGPVSSCGDDEPAPAKKIKLNTENVDLLDVARAFTDPRVVAVVAQVLLER